MKVLKWSLGLPLIMAGYCLSDMHVALAVVSAKPMMCARSSCLDEIYCAVRTLHFKAIAAFALEHFRRRYIQPVLNIHHFRWLLKCF